MGKEKTGIFYSSTYFKYLALLFWKDTRLFLKNCRRNTNLLSRGTTITVSNSTKKDLLERHFKDVYICPEGNYIRYESYLIMKKDYFIYVGRLVPYKRVEDAILMAHHLKEIVYSG